MTKKAEELNNLITSSYQALEEDRRQSESSRTGPQPDVATEHETPAARHRLEVSTSDRGLFRNWLNLVRTAGGKVPYGLGLAIMLLAAIGLAVFGVNDAGTPSNESADTATGLDQDSPAVPEPDSVDNASATPEFVDTDGSNPLSGTWVMYWRNAEDTDSAAFTLRFNGVNGGSVEVLNDNTESDTWIELDGNTLRFGFTRTSTPPASWPADVPFPAEALDEKTEFNGTRVSDGQFLGNSYRDGWECQPDLTPPCSTNPNPDFYTAWIEQEP